LLIPDLGPDFLLITDPDGSKKAPIPDLGSGSATQPLIQNQSLFFCSHVTSMSDLLDPGLDTHFQTLIALAGSVEDPDPGSGAFLIPGSGAFLIPGSGMGRSQHPDPGSGMNNPDHIFQSLETIFLG
jgi:hypothetical protein